MTRCIMMRPKVRGGLLSAGADEDGETAVEGAGGDLLLDVEAWDTPRRLSLNDAWVQTGAQTGGRSFRATRPDDEAEDDR